VLPEHKGGREAQRKKEKEKEKEKRME